MSSNSQVVRTPEFEKVIMGGTFDFLHKGHKRLLKTAFDVGKEVWIGLTTDRFVKRAFKLHVVDKYEIREKGLKEFLKKEGLIDRAKIFPIDDPYGPSLESNDIGAIVVSQETESTAIEINVTRKLRGLKPLKIVRIDMVLADDSIPISSTRIRAKEIDREGRIVKKSYNLQSMD